MALGTINSGGAKPQDLSGYLKTEQLGKAGGVAPLDAQAKIILDYLYTNTANALAKLDASGKLPVNLIPALSAYIAASAKGAANGVASLDTNGKLPSGQLTEHAHAYSDLTGIPSTFPPASHSHAASEITGAGNFATGSYTGTGTLSMSLTFSFVPKLLIIFGGDHTGGNTSVSGDGFYVISPYGDYSYYRATGMGEGFNMVSCSVSGKTITWLRSSVYGMANTSGVTYNYYAFG